MATTLTTGDLVEAVFFCTAGKTVSRNVRHFEVESTAGASRTDEMAAEAFDNRFGPLLKDVMSSSATYLGCSVQILQPTLREKVFASALAGAGEIDTDLMSPFTCGRLKLLTARAGRRFRGRIYVPFPPESRNTVAGRPDGNYLVGLRAFGDGLVLTEVITVAPNSATLVPVIWSRKFNTREPLITASIVSDWGQLRSRSFLSSGDSLP